MKKTIYMTALLAVASFGASAAVTSDAAAATMLNGAVYTNTSLSTSESAITSSESVTGWTATTDDSFTLTATLDVAELSKRLGTADNGWASWNERSPLLYVTANQIIGIDMFVYNSENGIGAMHGRTDFTVGADGTYGNLTTTTTGALMHQLQVIDFTNVTSAAITFSHRDREGTAVALTLVSVVDGVTTVTTYEGTKNNIKWHSGIGDPTTITYDDAIVPSLYLMEGGLDVGEGMEYLNKAAINMSVPEPATATLSLLALAGLATRRRRK